MTLTTLLADRRRDLRDELPDDEEDLDEGATALLLRLQLAEAFFCCDKVATAFVLGTTGLVSLATTAAAGLACQPGRMTVTPRGDWLSSLIGVPGTVSGEPIDDGDSDCSDEVDMAGEMMMGGEAGGVVI